MGFGDPVTRVTGRIGTQAGAVLASLVDEIGEAELEGRRAARIKRRLKKRGGGDIDV